MDFRATTDRSHIGTCGLNLTVDHMLKHKYQHSPKDLKKTQSLIIIKNIQDTVQNWSVEIIGMG